MRNFFLPFCKNHEFMPIALSEKPIMIKNQDIHQIYKICWNSINYSLSYYVNRSGNMGVCWLNLLKIDFMRVVFYILRLYMLTWISTYQTKCFITTVTVLKITTMKPCTLLSIYSDHSKVQYTKQHSQCINTTIHND